MQYCLFLSDDTLLLPETGLLFLLTITVDFALGVLLLDLTVILFLRLGDLRRFDLPLDLERYPRDLDLDFGFRDAFLRDFFLDFLFLLLFALKALPFPPTIG